MFQNIQNLIKFENNLKPEPKQRLDVADFLWQHMLRNISDLQKTLNRSTDDVFLTMHLVVKNITSIRPCKYSDF